MTILLVALGGALGAALRYGLSLGAGAALGVAWPWGTFLANVLGSFLLGLVSELAQGRAILGVDARLPLGVGLLGGFTTYSSFNLEILKLYDAGLVGRAASYAGATLALCLAAGVAGVVAGRALRAT